jgi:hypothetical protein
MEAQVRNFFNSSAILLVALAFGMTACGDEPEDKLEVNKTSNNTWTIYDPDYSPDRYLDQTCQSEGKLVANLTAPGEAYGWLYVTCADTVQPEPTTTPDPGFGEDEEEFTP